MSIKYDWLSATYIFFILFPYNPDNESDESRNKRLEKTIFQEAERYGIEIDKRSLSRIMCPIETRYDPLRNRKNPYCMLIEIYGRRPHFKPSDWSRGVFLEKVSP